MLANTMTEQASVSQSVQDFVKRVEDRDAIIGIIGLGYVGLPLSRTFTQAGFRVLGFDVDEKKIAALKEGRSYMRHFPDQKVADVVGGGLFEGTTDMSRLGEPDALLMCVPTPLNSYREPDLSFVEITARAIARKLRPNQLVVLESTTWPGTSEEVILPILEEGSGLSAETDFGLAYSPEREDPGNLAFETGQIPKVVGAHTRWAHEMAMAVYGAAVSEVVPVVDTRTAEAVKLTENIFRLVNIGMVNELKTILAPMGVDIWKVIDAAKTKPFGFMPFYPGPGLGGHCIPIDPFYLTWKARADGNPTRFIELAGEINAAMPERVVQKAVEELNRVHQKAAAKSKVLVIGIAYKKNIDDMRESPAFPIIEGLIKRNATVEYHDPFVPEVPYLHEHANFEGWRSVPLTKDKLRECDLVLIAADHDNVDYQLIIDNASCIVDTRNAMVTKLGPHVEDVPNYSKA